MENGDNGNRIPVNQGDNQEWPSIITMENAGGEWLVDPARGSSLEDSQVNISFGSEDTPVPGEGVGKSQTFTPMDQTGPNPAADRDMSHLSQQIVSDRDTELLWTTSKMAEMRTRDIRGEDVVSRSGGCYGEDGADHEGTPCVPWRDSLLRRCRHRYLM